MSDYSTSAREAVEQALSSTNDEPADDESTSETQATEQEAADPAEKTAESGPKEPSWEPDAKEFEKDPAHAVTAAHDAHRRSSVSNAVDKFQRLEAGERSLKEASNAVAQLRQFVPGRSVSEWIDFAQKTEAALANPKTRWQAAEELLREAHAHLPPPSQRKAEGDRSKTPDGLPALDDCFARALEQVDRDSAEDRDALCEAYEAYGAKLGEKLSTFADRVSMVIEDPEFGVGKIMASLGEPITESHQRETAQAKEVQKLTGWIEGMQQSEMPELSRPEIEGATVRVLEDPKFPRTGSQPADLRNAYHIALKLHQDQSRRQANEQSQQKAQAALKTKAALSVTGGQRISTSDATAPAGTARAAVERAMT